MAREKDITRRPKFFGRKKGVTDDMLCDRCKPHKYVILVRYGCDALMYTDTKLRSPGEYARAGNEGRFIHLWCVNEDIVPDCVAHYKEIQAI